MTQDSLRREGVAIGRDTGVALGSDLTLATAGQWPKIDLLKLDVEGMELAAIRGAETLIFRDKPVILFEAEPESLALRGATLPKLLAWLKERSYVVMHFSATDGSPQPVAADHEPMTVNLVAIPTHG